MSVICVIALHLASGRVVYKALEGKIINDATEVWTVYFEKLKTEKQVNSNECLFKEETK